MGVSTSPDNAVAIRFSPFLWISVFAAGGALCVVAPLPTCVGGACLWLCFGREVGVRLTLVALLAATLGVVRAKDTVSRFTAERERSEAVLRPPSRCAFNARILDSPTVREGTTRLRVVVEQGSCEERQLPPGTKVRLYGGPSDLARGDRVEVIGQLGVTRLFRNHDLPDPLVLSASDGVVASGSAMSLTVLDRSHHLSAKIDRARNFVRERIMATFSPAAAGMAKALVLGENDLSEEEDHSFKVSGLAHMLAVSGTHLVFAVVSITTGLRVLIRTCTALTARTDGARWGYVFGAILALVYADFAGGSGSAWRAAWMLAWGFMVQATGRRVRAADCVAASIAIGLTVDPLISLDLSFLLSVAATGGLMTWGRVWSQRVAAVGHKGLEKLLQGMSATLASTIPCSVLLAPLSSETSLVGLLANTLAAPFGEAIALPLCLTHCVTAWWPALEKGVALVASGALLVVRQVALVSARGEGFGIPLPYPDAWQYAAAFAALTAAFSLWGARNRTTRHTAVFVLATAVLGWGIAELRMRWDGRPHALRVTFLDVEQGDSALVDFPDGRLMLVDGGGFVGSSVDPGRIVILPVLRRRRRDALDVVALSHPHPDHFGGLASVIDRVPVREFWDTGQGQAEGAGPVYAEILRAAGRRGVRVLRPETLCGSREFGGAMLDVLAPCPDFEPNGPANDNSLVMRLSHRGRSVLFVGDAERAEEEQLLATAGDHLRAEVLKVGHHGSRTSTSAPFLARVKPNLAVISCGIRNRFGHPHQTTLDRLTASEVVVWRTDKWGSAVWLAE